MATKVLAINLRFGFCFLQWASDRIHEPESIYSGYAVCTKHLSWMTALSKMIFDKQLAALGQRQNQICSLKPADSKKGGLDTKIHPVMVALGKRGKTRDSMPRTS
jgi:hypothetical protein